MFRLLDISTVAHLARLTKCDESRLIPFSSACNEGHSLSGPQVLEQPLSRCVACSPHNTHVPQTVELALGEVETLDLASGQNSVSAFKQECLNAWHWSVDSELLDDEVKLILSNNR